MKYSIDKNDKKEQRLYRIVRIVFILAIVLIVGLKFSGSKGNETTEYVSEQSEPTDIETLVEQSDLSEYENEAFEAADEGTDATEEKAAAETIESEAVDEGTDADEKAAAETIESDTVDESTDIEPNETAVKKSEDADVAVEATEYVFRSKKLLEQHYEKHGIEMGFSSAKEYEKAASDVVNNPNALHKTEAEDGDFVYYVEETNEFVIVSTDGYLRTYFLPSAGKKYYDKQ